MSPFEKISPDDPRLTTYALGEMEPAERAEFEQLLAQDADALALVAEINGTAQHIGVALAGESLPVVGTAISAPALGQAAIIPGRDRRKYDGGSLHADEGKNGRSGWGQLLRFPNLYFTISGVAAACFALGFIIWQTGYVAPKQVQYTEVDLSMIAPAQPAQIAEPVKIAVDKTVVGESLIEVSLNPVKSEPAPMELVVVDKNSSVPAGPVAVALPVAPTNTAVEEKSATVVASGEVKSADVPVAMIATASAPEVNEGLKAEPVKKPEMVVAANTAPSGKFIAGLIDTTGLAAPLSYAGQAVDGSVNPNAYKDSPQNIRISGALSFNPGILQGDERSRRAIGWANTESYERITDNAFLVVKSEPLSTFSIDVDTAAYSNVRRFIQSGQRPPADAVRIEELVNYFPYHYAAPEGMADSTQGSSVAKAREDKEGIPPSLKEAAPFAAHLEVASAPWASEHRLVRIGLKGREVSAAARPTANLVFLLDVSGSMNQPNKLPLVQESLRMLVDKLRKDDRVAIVVYAGASGLALPSTRVADKREILEAIEALRPGGSTNGAMGIQLAYDIAKANFVEKGINRIVLCTDGDFNVGVTNRSDLTRLVEKKAKSGVFLTVLGFGMGNLKDATLEQLADKGNGNYGYIDSRREAQKLLVEQAGGTLMTIAKDVKIQVEFNPAQVQAYRLIGYENRMLRKEDFNNDKIDAGEIGAGHTVTALYEVVPAGAEWKQEGGVDGLKYQKTESEGFNTSASGELLTVKLRYKQPDGDVSSKLEFALRDTGRSFEQASADFKFAASVAAFGMILRESPHKGTATFASVTEWAQAGLVDDAGGYRSEFVGLIGQAERLAQN